MPIIFYVVILFVVLEFFSYLYSKLFAQLKFLRFSIILGIFLHEFSHYLACKLTFAKVRKFHISKKKGYVIHSKSKIPIVGGLIISFAPFFIGLISLFAVLYYLNNNNNLLIFAFDAVKTTNWSEVMMHLRKWIFNLEYTGWQFWLSVFLSLNILATFTPSRKDYKNILSGILLYIVFSILFDSLRGINLVLVYLLSIANIILIAAVFFLIVVNLIQKGFKSM